MSDSLDKTKTIGVVDEPNPGENDDTLSIDRHAQALTEYIKYCDTPMTIGIQGEWGSGKTSLLYSIREAIGQDNFAQIWINSWEHSLLLTPEEALLKIINHIINEMIKESGQQENKSVREAAKGIMKGALRVGASLTLGNKGSEVVEEFLDEESNAIKQLRKQLEDLAEYIIQHGKKKIIVYVDDLDRIEPRNAVQILELLKNIFSISHCVFVLAIDYQVVVKGLEHKFGKRTEENEWEFRAFFDKIINLPFMMPMGQYDIGQYVSDLLKKIGYLDGGDDFTEEISTIISYSIGGNPRSLKRLVNSLALIDIFKNLATLNEDPDYKEPNTGDDEEESNPEKEAEYTKQLEDEQRKDLLMFSLVCLQISYPEVYDLLDRKPDFTKWDDDFSSRITQKKEEGLDEVEKEKFITQFKLAKATDDFNEKWEEALYRICYTKPRYRAHVKEMSRLLTYIKDEILKDIKDDDIETFIASVLQQTSVTSVKTTDQSQQISETKPFERIILDNPEEGLQFYFEHNRFDLKQYEKLLIHIDDDMRKYFKDYRFQYSKTNGATIYVDNKQSKIGQISIQKKRTSMKLGDGAEVGYNIGPRVEIILWRSMEKEWRKPRINERVFSTNVRPPHKSFIRDYVLLIPSIDDYEEVKTKIYKLLELSKKTYEDRAAWKRKGQKPNAKYARILFSDGQQYNKKTGGWPSSTFKKYVSNDWTYDVE
mgnify:CR=1 FL=1